MMIITNILLITIILMVVFSRSFLAENLVSYFLGIFLFSLFLSVIKFTSKAQLFKGKNKFSKIFSGIRNHPRFKLFVFLSTLLILLVASSLDRTYYLGGDDTRLFYLYPELYFENYANRVVPTSSTSGWIGFLTPRVLFYFSTFLMLLHKILPWTNLQTFLYLMNLVAGFYFFYKLLGYISKKEFSIRASVRVVSSMMYVFSIFNIYVLFNAKLVAIYALSIVPLTIYLFLKAVTEKKLYLVAGIAFIWSVFAVISSSVFWYSATFLTFFPVMLYLLRNHKIRMLKYLFFLLAILMVFNIHWLIYLPYTSLFRPDQGLSQISLSGVEFININIEGIRSTALHNDVFYPLVNLFHYGIQRSFHWPYVGIFESWYLALIPLNIIILLTLILANVFVQKRKSKILLGVTSLSFLIAVYLFTVNIGSTNLGNWGIELFVYLSKNVPGFLSYRNMFDKFAHALSFNFAIVTAISLSILLKYPQLNKHLNSVIVIFTAVILLNALPFLMGRFDSLPVWRTNNTYHQITDFNEDYLDLTSYVSSQKYSGRYLSLPLDRGNIMPIQDKYKNNHYYIGVSPMLMMSGKNDYSGSLSFGPFGKELLESLYDEDYQRLGEILRHTNTKYIITNNTISEDLQRSYLYGQELYDIQNEAFLHAILGEKIKDFGVRYSLYSINKNFDNEKIFLSQDPNKFPNEHGDIKYHRINDYTYEVSIDPSVDASYLVLMEPYYEEWDLYMDDDMKLQENQIVAFDYANAWNIEDLLVNSEKELKLKIVFTPGRYKDVSLLISIVGMIGVVVYIVLSHRKINEN